MPFRAQCLFCGHEVLAPDHALGGSACCPKCSSFFTLAPAAEARATAVSGGPEASHKATTKASATSSAVHAQYSLGSKQATEPALGAGIGLLPKARLVTPRQAARPRARWVDPFAMGAMLSGGAALLCASAPALCKFVLPLAALGLLQGAAGLLVVLVQGRTRLMFPVTGTTVASVILFTALLFPKLLGPVFLASRARDAIDPTAIRVVPLPGNPGSIVPGEKDWVDASRAALQQGRVNVQVISALVRRVQSKSSPSKKVPPGDYLFIRLRTQQVDTASQVAGKRPQAPGFVLEKASPKLTDNTGKGYQLCDVLEMAETQKERKSSVFPVLFQDQALVFEAPAGQRENLRLEVAAEAWGGKGAFRFTIPASMIHDERAGTGRLPGRR